MFSVGPNTHGEFCEIMVIKNCWENKLKYMGVGPPLLSLIQSQANFIYPNGPVHSPVLPINHPSVVNDPFIPTLIYYADSVHSKFVPIALINSGNNEAGEIYFLSEIMGKSLNGKQPVTQYEEDGKCLFEFTNKNEGTRIQFFTHQRDLFQQEIQRLIYENALVHLKS